tara:strand:+ start:2485 stop:2682 length:198 start_codon:yes stop_codon:yes gene_type:complete
LKQKKYEEYLKRTLPESEEVECKNCTRKFFDEWNLLSLASLDMCMLCANRNIDKQTIERKYQNVK